MVSRIAVLRLAQDIRKLSSNGVIFFLLNMIRKYSVSRKWKIDTIFMIRTLIISLVAQSDKINETLSYNLWSIYGDNFSIMRDRIIDEIDP